MKKRKTNKRSIFSKRNMHNPKRLQDNAIPIIKLMRTENGEDVRAVCGCGASASAGLTIMQNGMWAKEHSLETGHIMRKHD